MDFIPLEPRKQKRVVITGVGFITPAGNTRSEFWTNICSGKSSLKRSSWLNLSDSPVKIVGEASIPQDQNSAQNSAQNSEREDRSFLLADFAAKNALLDAGLSLVDSDDRESFGLSIGTGAGPTQGTEQAYLSYFERGPRAMRPKTIPSTMISALAANLSIDYHLRGPQLTVSTACASSNSAMCRAIDLVRSGAADCILTGGVEMPLSDTIFHAWLPLRVMATSEDPNLCCLPFDRRRSGFSMAEGAAMFVFESLDSAVMRGAKIHAEVLGYGENSDALHLTRPNPTSQAKAIKRALTDARMEATSVDYINAHGTGTLANDSCEAEAIRGAFGDHAGKIPVSSTKSVIGHGLGASGAMELVAVLEAISHQIAPPTANLNDPDPNLGLHLNREPESREIRVALSNSFAFGGVNSVLVLGRHFS